MSSNDGNDGVNGSGGHFNAGPPLPKYPPGCHRPNIGGGIPRPVHGYPSNSINGSGSGASNNGGGISHPVHGYPNNSINGSGSGASNNGGALPPQVDGSSDGVNFPNNNAATPSWRRGGDITMGVTGGEWGGRFIRNFGGDHTIHIASVSPGPVYPSKNQLTVAYGYAIRREDGTYTRLIRADELRGLIDSVLPTQEGAKGIQVRREDGTYASLMSADELRGLIDGVFPIREGAQGIQVRHEDGTYTSLMGADEFRGLIDGVLPLPTQEGAQGLIVLPAPNLAVPEKRREHAQYVTGAFVQSLPKNRSNDFGSDGAQDQDAFMAEGPEKAQLLIDQILATNPVPSPFGQGKTFRRQKIYCDKWIHEGVCAFTQLGCKYKHEMPMDKATQMSLGLNHGLPAWYKRAHAVHIRPEGVLGPQGSPQGTGAGASLSVGGKGNTGGHTGAMWRRENSSGGGHGFSGSPPADYGQKNFGPIGPPPPPYSTNPFAVLEDTSMESNEEGEIVD